jgi:hypothetical protein
MSALGRMREAHPERTAEYQSDNPELIAAYISDAIAEFGSPAMRRIASITFGESTTGHASAVTIARQTITRAALASAERITA